MYGVAASGSCYANNLRAVEIASYAALPQGHVVISVANVQALFIVVGVDGHGAHAELPGRLGDAHRDLAAIGYQ